MNGWVATKTRIFFITINVALLIGQYYRSTIIHQRNISIEDIVKRVLGLVIITIVVAYMMMKGISLSNTRVGMQLITFGMGWTVCLFISRYAERQVIKKYRKLGGNTRMATFIGSDPELLAIYSKLKDAATKGYSILGYYADDEMKNMPAGVEIKKLGTMTDLMDHVKNDDFSVEVGDEIYVCLSRLQRDVIRKISSYCDQKLVRFYYVPVSVETLGIDLKRELLDDMEIFTTYENPLMNPVNKVLKRAFDIVMSLIVLLIVLPFMPILWLIIKIQSPGPLFFKQLRTGLDGQEFYCYKFRSMHVNADADKVQATKDDPRKYPFGNFMRKANIDELPQFWNVLRGDMSIVGPRPHMLAHTEQYSQLIEKYMVRHFLKPGVTGWAQVTGFRGETKELWQMEGRVKRDIWYMEHWSIWLDIRIIWMTLKTVFVHDKHAY
jgi:putative colanic acid biosynthesis UDP-glucose lipid carrier transferase